MAGNRECFLDDTGNGEGERGSQREADRIVEVFLLVSAGKADSGSWMQPLRAGNLGESRLAEVSMAS